MRIFLGLLGIICGFLVMKYAYPIKRGVGSMDWAEKVFGVGGTTTAFQLIGLLIAVGGFLWMTGVFETTIRMLFGGIVGMGKQ